MPVLTYLTGKFRKYGFFDYTPRQQRIEGVGPIPAGEYWIRPNQIVPVGIGRDGWGRFRVTIHYFPNTQIPGRKGGFFIHGGKEFGSAGCIDLAKYMDSFVQKMKELFFGVEVPDPGGGGVIPGYSNCYIPLTVKYGVERVDLVAL